MPTSGLDQYLAHKPGAAPATLYEAERLRQDAGLGPSGPMGSDQLITGMTRRYGWAPEKVIGVDLLWERLDPGTSATLSGHPIDAPIGSPFRRFLPRYTGGHRTSIYRLDTMDHAWLIDPEWSGSGYTGQWVTKADIIAFGRNGSAHTLATMALATTGGGSALAEVDMISTLGAGKATIGALGARIYSTPDANIAPLASRVPKGTVLTKLGSISGWRLCVVSLGSTSSTAWLRKDEIAAETADPSLNAAIVAGSVTGPSPADLVAARSEGYAAAKLAAETAVEAI